MSSAKKYFALSKCWCVKKNSLSFSHFLFSPAFLPIFFFLFKQTLLINVFHVRSFPRPRTSTKHGEKEMKTSVKSGSIRKLLWLSRRESGKHEKKVHWMEMKKKDTRCKFSLNLDEKLFLATLAESARLRNSQFLFSVSIANEIRSDQQLNDGNKFSCCGFSGGSQSSQPNYVLYSG